MTESPEEHSMLGDLWDGAGEVLSGAGDALDAGYHAGVAGAEVLLGDDQGAANQWDQAGHSAADAGGHFEAAGQDFEHAYEESGINPGDLVM
jgi:hypothetical protein